MASTRAPQASVRERGISLLVCYALMGVGLGAPLVFWAEHATAQAAPHDGVPEWWVPGSETIDAKVLDRADRIRVLAGARLTVTNSVLRFADHPGGLTGLVAEPGSEVVIQNSVIEASGAAGSFLVHLEGNTLIEGTTIRGAATVVLQPRSATDYVDEALGAQLQGRIPGWRLARIQTAGSAVLRDSTVEGGTGPGLTVGAPVQYRADLAAAPVLVQLERTVVRSAAADALSCYATQQTPDPDSAGNVPLLAGAKFTELVLIDVRLETAGAAALHCPSAPVAAKLPQRNLPVLDPVLLAPVNALLPAPPVPEAIPGPQLVRMTRGAMAGTGTGALLDGSTRLDAAQTQFVGLAPAVRLIAATASALLTDPAGASLGVGVDVSAGSLEVQGGALAGAPGMVGAHVTGGTVTLNRLTLSGYAACAHLDAAPATITNGVLQSCLVGLLLDRVGTRATVTGNRFLDDADPLRVASPNDAANAAHFDHAVTANTVHGKALVYAFQRNGLTFPSAGHAVVAHSTNIRVGQLDLAHGTYHVHASSEVVIGSLTDQQTLLASTVDAGVATAFASVWNGVQYEVYPGALKGPIGAEQQAIANEYDQAWMLVEKARALGRTARFVTGDIVLPRSAFLTWTGFTNEGAALSQSGLGGALSPTTFFKDHVWAEVQAAPGVWLELDPSYKQYDWLAPPPLPNEGNTDVADDLVSTLTFQNADVLATVDHAGLDAQLAAHEGAMSAWTDDRIAEEATMGAAFGGARQRAVAAAEEAGHTPEARLAAVPASSLWSFQIRLEGVSHTGTTADLYGKRVSVGSAPATAADVQTIENAGGMDKVSRFSVNLLTTLSVGGQSVGVAGPHHPGDLLNLEVDFRGPGGQLILTKDSPVHAGGAYAVALDIGRTPAALENQQWAGYQATLDAMFAVGQAGGDVLAGVTVDQRYGQMMQAQGWHYFARVHDSQASMATKLGVRDQPLMGAGITGQSVVPVFAGGMETVQPMPPYIDVQFLGNSYPRDGDNDRNVQYALQAGAVGSMLEGHIFLELYGTQGLSTVHILQTASAQGQKIYRITAANLESQLAQTVLPGPVENAIRNAVSRGMDVYTHHQQLTIQNWTGAGWIEFDAETGANGWLIYGGVTPLSGESITLPHAFAGGSGVTWEGFLNWLKAGLLLLLRALGSPAAPWMGLISGLVDLVLKYQEFDVIWQSCQGVNNNPDMRVRGDCVQRIFPVALSMLLSLVLVSVSIACLLLGGLLCFFFLGVAIARFLIATIGLFE